jgi:NAD(P)-dependent dehydrogenase (short-subunit alcohol dehydrogenase family)
MSKTWFVTGASKGLGLALVKKLLAAGYNVAATSRNEQSLKDAVNTSSAAFLPLQTDLLNEASIQQSVDKALQQFGKIDVVVNNAGFGQIGTLEELSDKESRENFDVNVFGLLNVVRRTMPYLRAQRSGHIFNIASVGGYSGNFPGWGIYCATKFAVAGLTESLAAEAKDFGVFATVVYPGYFRTEFLTAGSMALPSNPIEEYASARASQIQHQEQLNGAQPGDPDKAADVMIAVAEAAAAPVHLFLGADAYRLVKVKDDLVHSDMAAWETKAAHTDL